MVPSTPEPKMILIAPSLNFRSKNRQTANNPISTHFRLETEKFTLPSRKTANVRMESPAQEIRDTTAGRRQESTVRTPEKLRYL